jgi:hypothetical protein
VEPYFAVVFLLLRYAPENENDSTSTLSSVEPIFTGTLGPDFVDTRIVYATNVS